MHDLGIRREYKNRWERRAPLIPDHVRELIRDQGVRVAVQSSPLRIFGDDEYRAVGADIVQSLDDCRVILGLKELCRPSGSSRASRNSSSRTSPRGRRRRARCSSACSRPAPR